MVRVTVSDRKNDAGGTDTAVDDTIDVTITVTNVNEPPAFGAATASNLYFYESNYGKQNRLRPRRCADGNGSGYS